MPNKKPANKMKKQYQSGRAVHNSVTQQKSPDGITPVYVMLSGHNFVPLTFMPLS